MFLFPCLNQRYDIIICVYWFELFSQVSDVAHGPLVYLRYQIGRCFKSCVSKMGKRTEQRWAVGRIM